MSRIFWALALALNAVVGHATPVLLSGSAIVRSSSALSFEGGAYQYTERPTDLGQRLDFHFRFDSSGGAQTQTANSVRAAASSGCRDVVNGICTQPSLEQAAVVGSASLADKPMFPPGISGLIPIHKTHVSKFQTPALESFDLLFDRFQTVITGDVSTGHYLEQFVETGLVLLVEGPDVFADLDLGETPAFELLLGSAQFEVQYLRVESSCLYVDSRCATPQVTGELMFLDVDRIAQVSEVAEPGVLALFSIGLAGIAAALRRRYGGGHAA